MSSTNATRLRPEVPHLGVVALLNGPQYVCGRIQCLLSDKISIIYISIKDICLKPSTSWNCVNISELEKVC